MGEAAKDRFLRGLLPNLRSPSLEVSAAIDQILHTIREHLGLDVAFVSEFTGEERVFRHVDAAGWSPIKEGDVIPLDVGYCKRVVEGALPRLIADTHANPAAMVLPETRSIPIGAHLSVPIRLADGRLYGTFCCFGFRPERSLNNRDLEVMEAFAEVVAYQIGREIECNAIRNEKINRVQAIIEQGGPDIVFQPICNLQDTRVVGVECLSRFPTDHHRTPDAWFAEAATVGLSTQLENCAIRNALRALQHLPADMYMAVNVSPETVMAADFERLFHEVDAMRIVLELTEHAHVEDYGNLRHSLDGLRTQGLRIAVDDAGAGYASMRHILNLQPDIIKLDMSLTRSIDSDLARRALAAALIEFGRQTGSVILAEGVETLAELNLLRSLGASNAQGFYLSPPLPLAQAVRQAWH